jgi:hypothetical protein
VISSITKGLPDCTRMAAFAVFTFHCCRFVAVVSVPPLRQPRVHCRNFMADDPFRANTKVPWERIPLGEWSSLASGTITENDAHGSKAPTSEIALDLDELERIRRPPYLAAHRLAARLLSAARMR